MEVCDVDVGMVVVAEVEEGVLCAAGWWCWCDDEDEAEEEC